MTPEALEAAAKALYDACPTSKPDWDQLMPGGATQSVWKQRALVAHYKDLLT